MARLVENGVPVDVIGLEFHLIAGEDNPTVDDIVNYFAYYQNLGLDVCVTELDIAMSDPVTPEKLEEQARLYGIVLRAAIEADSCDSFTLWGFTDKHSWYTEWGPEYTAPCLFDEDMQPKPAYHSVIEVMEGYVEE